MKVFRKKELLRTSVLVVLSVFFVFCGSMSCRSQEKKLDKVFVGAAPSLPGAGLFIAKEKGYFEDEGLDVDIQIFRQSTVQELPLLATNRLDVGTCGYSSGLLNAFIKETGIRMVADQGHHGPGHSHLAMLISKQHHPGRLTADVLRGKTFAVPTRGVIQEIITERFLKKYGLTLDDVELVNLSYPNMNTALVNGSIYGVLQLEPFVASAVHNGYAVEIIRAAEMRPRFQGGVLLYSEAFRTERRDAADRFMVAYLEGVRYFNDFLNGKMEDDKEIFEIIKKYTSAKNYDAFKIIGFGGVNPYGYLDKKSVQEDIDWYYERGYIKKKPDVNEIVDDSFASYADKKLGTYYP